MSEKDIRDAAKGGKAEVGKMSKLDKAAMREEVIDRRETSATPTFSGIGESRTFNDPNAEERLTPVGIPIEECHINGTPIFDLYTPEQVAVMGMKLYDFTDEKLGGRNEELREVTGSGFVDEQDKSAMERYYAIVGGTPHGAAPDPRNKARKHMPEGFEPRWLSPKHPIAPADRGFLVVTDGKGDPVKMQNMILGMRPIAVGESKRKAEREPYKDMDKVVKAQHDVHVETILRENPELANESRSKIAGAGLTVDLS